MSRDLLQVLTTPLGGSPLALAALGGQLPQWYLPQLDGSGAWRAATLSVAREFADRDWLQELRPALKATGDAAARLDAVARGNGVVVTTGQQPGLFGGPLYVLSKALTALELANAIETATGLPCAPVFWAATDDADFAEASHVSVVVNGTVVRLQAALDGTLGKPMSDTSLGDVSPQLSTLTDACGSALDTRIIAAVTEDYELGETVGGAYVRLLRGLLQPLGVAVLDAGHDCVREAARPTLRRALERAAEIATALFGRARAIRDAGFTPQVADVPDLSLVFRTDAEGRRVRVPVRVGADVARDAAAQRLSPNVLLRPIVERQILPTVAYVGGPGEIAYFAQVSAVAEALQLAIPRIVPRWSGVLVEPHVREILDQLHATVEDFSDPHALDGRIARAQISTAIQSALTDARRAIDDAAEHMVADRQTTPALRRSVESMRASVTHKLARLERRYTAAVKREGSDALHDAAVARASLFPDGKRQERVLSFVPFIARYGKATTDALSSAARNQAENLIRGG